jgi:ferredoxin
MAQGPDRHHSIAELGHPVGGWAGRALSWAAPYQPTTVPTIRVDQEGQQVGCIEGANLRKAALDAGINPYKGLNNFNNCGGLGQCGTCVVEVLEGARNLSPRSDVEEVYLADRPASYRLSCRTTVNGDVTVRTRPSEGVGKGSNSLVGALKALVGRG